MSKSRRLKRCCPTCGRKLTKKQIRAIERRRRRRINPATLEALRLSRRLDLRVF